MSNNKLYNDYLNREKEYKQMCLHKQCTECEGTGRKKNDGGMCFHNISCPCPKCTYRIEY